MRLLPVIANTILISKDMKQRLLFVLLCIASVRLFAQQNIYEIYALEFEKIDWRPLVSDIAVGATAKDTLQANMVIWLLKGNNGKTVLVDAGYVNKDHPKRYISPDPVLQKLNIRPGDITDIVLTHPH